MAQCPKPKGLANPIDVLHFRGGHHIEDLGRRRNCEGLLGFGSKA